MSGHFGNKRAIDTYRSKMKWLVGSLVSTIAILLTSVILIAMKQAPETKVIETEKPIEAKTTVDILVTNSRIEQGQSIASSILSSVPVNLDEMPMAAIRSKDVASVIGKFTSKMILANTPLMLDDIEETQPVKAFTIPTGYRAISINVDPRTAVGGFVTPGSRVDVMMTFKHRGERKITTLAHFVKVLSIGENTQNVQHSQISLKGTTATLLVKEQEAMKIELARNMGSLSLSLLGDSASPSDSKPSSPVGFGVFLGAPEIDTPEVAYDGTMYSSDPKTGRNVRYVLENGKWKVDRSYLQ